MIFGSSQNRENMLKELLSPEEVADELKVTKRTVYNWLRSGKLRGRKFGGVWRISASALAIPPESAEASSATQAEPQPVAEPDGP